MALEHAQKTAQALVNLHRWDQVFNLMALSVPTLRFVRQGCMGVFLMSGQMPQHDLWSGPEAVQWSLE